MIDIHFVELWGFFLGGGFWIYKYWFDEGFNDIP